MAAYRSESSIGLYFIQRTGNFKCKTVQKGDTRQ